MKKLLITASTFPRYENDTEPRFILDYANAMTKYYDVTVLAPAAEGLEEYEEIGKVKVERYHYFPIHKLETLCYPGAIVPRIREKKTRIFLVPFLFLALWIRLKKISKKYDVVHSHWLIPQGIVQSTIKDSPYIITGHGGDVTSLNFTLLKAIKISCLKKSRAITVVSQYLREKVKEMYPSADVIVIPMGCNTSRFSPEFKEENYFEQNSEKVILFVGRLAEKKGVTYLIEAMKKVNAKLYIVGTGPLETSLKKQAEEQGAKIIFLGAKTHEELPKIYASADLFVAPSIVASDGDQEGLPVSIMEAMASGLPVVSGLSGGVKDIIEDGINGYVVNSKDIEQLSNRINLVLNDSNKSLEMARAARNTALDYSYDNIAFRYHQVIESVLSKDK